MQWKFELLLKPSAVPLIKAQSRRVGWAMYP